MRVLLLSATLFFAGILVPSQGLADTEKKKPSAEEAADDSDDADREVSVVLERDGWMRYTNARFGFVLPVPPGMKSTRPPDNGDGQAFVSLDGKVTLTGWGSFNVDNFGDVEARWKDELEEKDRTITYKRKTENWYVVSGVQKDGTGFYIRYEANKNYCAGWMITYPQDQEKKVAPWIERIAKSYKPELGKGYDTLE